MGIVCQPTARGRGKTSVGAFVEDAQVRGPGMQIDAAVESVLTLVETHHGPPWTWVRCLSPHRGWKASALPENPTLGRGTSLSPFYLGTGAGPSHGRP